MKEKLTIQLKNIGLIILAICGLNACNDEFLELQPKNQISDGIVWDNINLVEAFVSESYKNLSMRTGFNSGGNNAGAFRLSQASDECQRRFNVPMNFGILTPADMDGVSSEYVNYWKHYYDIINMSNIFLENVQGENLAKLELQDSEKAKRMIGEMKFFRAYAYMRLNQLHGGVPLITEPFKLGDDYEMVRNSYDEVVQYVVAELNEVAELLPLTYGSDDVGRITKGAALGIKSRTLLYAASPLTNPENDKAKWQAAADAAKAVIDLGVYSLYSDYKQQFVEKYTEESIFFALYNNPLQRRHRIERELYPNGSQGYGQSGPSHNAVQRFETLKGLLPENDPDYDPQDPYVNRDPRFYAVILYDGAPWLGREIETFLPGGMDSAEGPEGWNASWSGYYWRKFVDESVTVPIEANTSNATWTFMRYAEILLNYAEAQFYLGNEEIAREYINMVRDRPSVKMPPVTETGTALEERLRNERFVELIGEEHRFFDVRRWRVASETNNQPALRMRVIKDLQTEEKTYTVEVTEERKFLDHQYWMPIPQSEMERTLKLEQTPGYL